jgi:hypothetical protein
MRLFVPTHVTIKNKAPWIDYTLYYPIDFPLILIKYWKSWQSEGEFLLMQERVLLGVEFYMVYLPFYWVHMLHATRGGFDF